MDTCSQGECGVTESACSDSSAGSVYEYCTSYNQAAVNNGDSDACTGTVSTRWTYDGYSYSQGPTSSPDPGSGGGTSDELGDCSCYCDAELTDFAGNVNVCDENGGDCGVTSAECSSLGPDQGCPFSAMSDDGSTLSPTWEKSCSTYYVEWFVNPSYSSGHSHDDSGPSGPVGDCECLCDGGGSFDPPTTIDGGVTQNECYSSFGVQACTSAWDTMVSNNNPAPCSSGTVDEVSTAWSP